MPLCFDASCTSDWIITATFAGTAGIIAFLSWLWIRRKNAATMKAVHEFHDQESNQAKSITPIQTQPQVSHLGKFVLMIPGVKMGDRTDQFYALFFTTTGIIVAVTADIATKNYRMIVDISPPFERSVLSNIRRGSIQRADILAQIEPDEILQSNESNFLIRYADIKSILIGVGQMQLEREMVVTSLDDKDFRFGYLVRRFDKTHEIIRELLPDKVSFL